MSKEKVERAKRIAEAAKGSLINYAIATHPNYTPSWHHHLIAEKLERVERGEIKRLFITMPPRHGKSELASIRFPAWYLGRNPTKKIIAVSNTGILAERFGREVKNLVEEPRHKFIFNGFELAKDQKRKREFATNKGGHYLAAGVDGTVTGYGADLFLIDDPVKGAVAADSETYRERVYAFFSSVASTRLEQGAAIIIIMTRWHKDDLVGRLLESDPDGWEVLDLPALATCDEPNRKEGESLWPAKYDTATLLEMKARMRPRDWYALYQQQPQGRETQEVYPEWLQYYQDSEEPAGLTITLAIDPAFSKNKRSDYTAMTVRGRIGNRRYVLDYVNKRIGESPSAIFAEALELIKKWNPYKIGIEAFAAQVMLGAYFREQLARLGIATEVVDLRIPNYANADVAKSRIRVITDVARQRNLFVKPWMEELTKQLLDFPVGKHDDLIDSLSFHEYFLLDFSSSEAVDDSINFTGADSLANISFDSVTGEPIF